MSTVTDNTQENLTPHQPTTPSNSPASPVSKDETPVSDPEQQMEAQVIRASQAQQIVKRYALNSMVTGFIPIPLVDMAALFGIQMKMLYDLAKQYEVPFSRNMVSSLVSAVLGGFIATTTAAPIAASLSKSLPLLGQASGMISMATIGGAGTYAVGQIFIEHFESGGTFLDFNPDKMKERFQALYEKGKQFVAQQQTPKK
jgi:uncharacterized protein (DUF697 family)